MESICSRCLIEVSPHRNGIIRYIDLSEIGWSHLLEELHCSICQRCICVLLNNIWQPIETVLTNPKKHKNGWHEAVGAEDALIIYIMGQHMYNRNSEETDPLFEFPDPGDHLKILWQSGQALGYYSLKLRGSLVYSTLQAYGMHTLDTAFVIPRYRRHGLGLALLQDFVSTYPDENLGISTPISKSMLHVVQKFLENEPKYKFKLWEIEGVGSQGGRKLLHYTLKNKLSSE